MNYYKWIITKLGVWRSCLGILIANFVSFCHNCSQHVHIFSFHFFFFFFFFFFCGEAGIFGPIVVYFRMEFCSCIR